MPRDEPPEYGTLLIAALLLLGLAFAGYWITTYVTPGANPWANVKWFGVAAAAIVVFGLAIYVRIGGGKKKP